MRPIGLGILAGLVSLCGCSQGVRACAACPPPTIYYPGPGWYASPLWPFTLCMRGPEISITLPDTNLDHRVHARLCYSCTLFDADKDGDVDLRDFVELTR